MSVEFEEDQQYGSQSFRSRQIMGEPVKPTMIKWLVKFGIVKDERYAGYILIGITILCFLISAIIFYETSKSPGSSGQIIRNFHPT